MTLLPLKPHFRPYRGSNERKSRKCINYNNTAQSVADYINVRIVKDSSEVQIYFFGMIAIELGVSEELVHEAISDGGSNGITIRVTDEDRVSLLSYLEARGLRPKP